MGGTLKRYIITDKSFYWEAILIIVPVVLQAIVNQGKHDGHHYGGQAGGGRNFRILPGKSVL